MKKITSEVLLLWVLVGMLALGQLGRISVTQSIRIYPHDLLLSFWLVYLVYVTRHRVPDFLLQTKKKLFKTWQLWVPFFASTTLSLLVAELQSPQALPLLYLGRIILYLFFAVVLWKFSRLTKEHFISGVIGLGLISLALGFLQLFFIPDTRFLFALGFDDHYYRMIGTQLDPAFLGAIFLVSLSAGLHSTLLKKHPTFKIGYTVVLIVGIILTFSRASYLGLFVLGIYEVLSAQKSALKLGLGILAFGIIAFIFSQSSSGEGTQLLRTASISARITSLKNSLPDTTQSWLIGKGPFYSVVGKETSQHATLSLPNQAKVSDSLVLHILNGWGILGIVSFVYLGGKIVLWLHRTKQHDSLQLLCCLLVITQFNNTLLHPFVLVSTLLLLSGYMRHQA